MSELWDESFSDGYRELLNEDGEDTISPAYHQLLGVEERYSEFDHIANGALKEVHSCHDRATQRRVAYALLKNGVEGKFNDLFIHEAWLTSSLQHPNIMKIYDVGVAEDGRPYFTMDLKSNQSLRDFVLAETELEVRLQAFLLICGAVSYAHSKGVLHLDLKPDNIQCDNFGEVLVCDWGLGKKVGEAEIEAHLAKASVHTLYGDVKGSPGYMAPEQIHQEVEKSTQTDIYALGAILHFILTQNPPFKGEDVMRQTQAMDFISPAKRYPHLKIPTGLDAVVSKAMRQNPQDRYSNVSEIISDIQLYLSGRTTSVEDSHPLKSLYLLVNRHKAAASITVGFIITLFVLGGLATKILSDKQKAAEEARGEALRLYQEMKQMNQKYDLIDGLMANQDGVSSALITASSKTLQEALFTPEPLHDQLHQAVIESNMILEHVMEICPDHPAIPARLLMNRFLMMDFKGLAGITLPWTGARSDRFNRYRKYAKIAPDFSYNASERPSVDELAKFLADLKERAADEVLLDMSMLESLILFDLSSRDSLPENYNIVLARYFELINKKSNLSVEVDFENGGVKFKSSGNLNVGFYKGKHSLLHKFVVDVFTFENAEKADYIFLDEIECRTLDFRKCAGCSFSQSTLVKGLESVSLPEGSHSGHSVFKHLLTDTGENIKFLNK